MQFTLGKYDFELRRAYQPWSHFRIHRSESTFHLIFGKVSIFIENWTLPLYRVCAMCGSDEIGEVHAGDEGWTVCNGCRSVEQGYQYLNKREWELHQ